MSQGNKIAILSGKGGTGKTLVAVNLAATLGNCTYVDCDVEEPNGHLFLKPKNIDTLKINVKIPKVKYELCDGCKKCVNFCRFNALSYTTKLEVFENICHSCGGCQIICPKDAIYEVDKTIGKIQSGNFLNIKVHSGFLNPGEASGVPIIDKLQSISKADNATVFIDCPPGSACTVMESIKDANYCLLVAEPTVFGAQNLEIVYKLVNLFNKPCGVILNKCIEGFNPSQQFCIDNGIEILTKIPFDKKLGEINSLGKIAVYEDLMFKKLFKNLLDKILVAL